MKLPRRLSRTLLSTVAVLTVTSSTLVPPLASAAPARVTAEAPGGAFTPVTPARIMDTRTGLGGTRLSANQTVELVVAGKGGVPTTGVSAAVLNVTVVGPTASGFATVYPTGTSRPLASNVNFTAGKVVPNLVLATLGSSGSISIFLSQSAGHVLVDVSGWFSTPATTAGTGGLLQPLTPARLLDTRTGLGGATLGPGQSLDLQVSGRGGVPASGASGAVLNATVVGPTTAGFLTVWPTGQARPEASNLNFVAKQIVPNRVVVGLGTGGKVSVHNGSNGTAQVLVDVGGWFTSAGASAAGAGYYQALSPVRAFDSRNTTKRINTAPTAVPLTGAFGVPADGVVAVVANTTVTRTTRSGHLTVYPGGPVPDASDLNFVAGLTVANLAIAKVDNAGEVSLRGSGGDLDAILDVAGYFVAGTSTPGSPPVVSTTSPLPQATRNAAYTTTLAATGGTTPYSWSLASGTLPAGLSLSAAGVLSGTPTAAGPSSFTVRVTDGAAATGTKPLSLTVVTPSAGAPSITTTSLPGATVGAPYSHTLTAAGGTPPYAWSSTAALPDGFALSGGGVLSGTPAAPFTATVSVQVFDDVGGFATKDLSLTATASPDPIITTAALPGGQQGVPYSAVLDATGGTGPYTYTVAPDSLPAGVTLSTQGVLGGTPTTLGTVTPTIQVTDSGARTATRVFTVTISGRRDWPQPGRDAGHRMSAADDTTLTPDNIAGLRLEKTLPVLVDQPAVVDGLVYSVGRVAGDEALSQLSAHDVGTGALSWSVPVACNVAKVAVTTTAVLFPCDGRLRAYDRAGTHALLWTTDVSDPTAAVHDFVILESGNRVIALDGTATYAYRLDTGARQWRQIFTLTDERGSALASDGTTVFVTTTKSLHAYAVGAGTRVDAWEVLGSADNVVVDGAAAYVTLGGELQRRSLTDAALTWSTSTGGAMRKVLAADGTKVYASWEQCNELGCTTTTRAFSEVTGAQLWEAETGTRPVRAAVTGELVWITRAAQGGANGEDTGGVTAYRVSDGGLVRALESGRRLFTPAVVAEGRVFVVRADGLKVFGFGTPPPTLLSQALRSGHVGRAYSDTLTASGGTSPHTWSVTSGTLPGGLSLASATGALTGTPTAAGSPRVTFRVTDARGLTASRTLVVQVSTAAAADWTTASNGTSRNGAQLGESVIGLDTTPQISEVWSSTSVGPDTTISGTSAVAGGLVYVPIQDGRVLGYPTGPGGATNRLPTYLAEADLMEASTTRNYFWGGVTVVSGRLLVVGQDGLYSFDAATGAKQWKAPFPVTQLLNGAPTVVGSRVIVTDGEARFRGFDLTTGAAAWAPYEPTSTHVFGGSLATDGTLVFGVQRCELFAVNASTGALAYSRVLSSTGEAFCSAFGSTTTPLVADGVVYTASYGGVVAMIAATGVVRWRRDYTAGGSMVLTGGVLVLHEFVASSTGGGYFPVLRAVDATTGSPVWTGTFSTHGGSSSHVAAAGDMVLIDTAGTVTGFDVRTGTKVWFSSSVTGNRFVFGPMVAQNRISFVGLDGKVHSYGIP